ncbi:MAG: hypothetical protein GYB25_14615 [Rhodobacteraceae bacterium]|nr:hypothetical protein [Paracoccaceae bacterium]
MRRFLQKFIAVLALSIPTLGISQTPETCDMGNAQDCLDVAEAYGSAVLSPPPKDAQASVKFQSLAVEAATPLCQDGNFVSCYQLIDAVFGTFFLPPLSIPQQAEALEVLSTVADRGCAQNLLDACYLKSALTTHTLPHWLEDAKTKGIPYSETLQRVSGENADLYHKIRTLESKERLTQRALCEGGDVSACIQTLKASSTRAPHTDVASLLRTVSVACVGGRPDACKTVEVVLSKTSFQRAPTPEQLQTAHEYREHVATLCEVEKEPGICGVFANNNFFNEGAASRTEALREIACRAGDAISCRQLGNSAYLSAEKDLDDRKRLLGIARTNFEKGCVLGDTLSCAAAPHLPSD